MAQDVFPMAHTLTNIEPIWPMLQNISKTLAAMDDYKIDVIMGKIYTIYDTLIQVLVYVIWDYELA